MTDKSLIKNSEFDKLPTITQMLEIIDLPCKVERTREEDFVIREFLRHGVIKKITTELNLRNKDMTFTPKDIHEFLVKFQDTVVYQSNLNKHSAVRRIMKTKEGLTHELLDLAIMAKELATKYDQADDHTAAIGAIKAASDIFFRNAKIEGLINDEPTINVNMQMDKLVQDVTSKPSSFAESIKNIVEADFEEVKKDA